MKVTKRKKAGALVVMGALALTVLVTGCAEQKVPVVDGMTRTEKPIQEVSGAPSWTWNDKDLRSDKKALYGVGTMAGIRNPALRRKQVDAQARNAVASVLGTYAAGLTKSFMASTTVGGNPDASEEQHVSDVLKQITEASLVGVKIIEYYERPDINQAYSLARLDIDQIVAMMESMATSNNQFKQLDAKLRDWVRKNAETANDQLNQELQKRHQP